MLAGLRSDARFEIDLGGGPPPGHRQGPSGIDAEGKRNLLNKISFLTLAGLRRPLEGPRGQKVEKKNAAHFLPAIPHF